MVSISDCQHFQDALTKVRILPLLLGLAAADQPLYLVGGAVRDLLQQRPVNDWDLVLPEDPTALAQAFARAIAGTWFWLDQPRRQSRVVRKHARGQVIYDFTPYRAPTLDGDLRARDFTVNAIAYELWTGTLIDPLGGCADLDARRLRLCGPGVLADDPLRVLRGLRYRLQLGLAADEETRAALAAHADACSRMPAERIGQELRLMLAAAPLAPLAAALADAGLLALAFGGGPTLWRRLPARAKAVDQQLELLQRRLRARDGIDLAQALALPRQEALCGWDLLRLGLLARDLRGSALVPHLGRMWKLNRQLLQDLTILQQPPPEPLPLAQLAPSPRARALWLQYLGDNPALLVAERLTRPDCDHRQQGLLLQAWRDWSTLSRRGRVPDLLDGHQLRRLTGVAGPRLGALVTGLRQAEMSGRIGSRDDALTWARKSVDKG